MAANTERLEMNYDCKGPGQNFPSTKRVANAPRRTLKEMAEEFGVSHGSLSMLLHLHGGPVPVLKKNTRAGASTWMDVQATRKWWKELQAKKQGV